MAHHGPPPGPLGADLDKAADDKIRRASLEHLRAQLGASGKFPEGKLVPHDEGEITLAVGTRDGKVVMEFGQPTAWVGYTPQQAVQIAESLLKHARAISDEVLTMEIGG